MKKTCVFVDGENFRHSLLDVLEYKPEDYLPKMHWDGFFIKVARMSNSEILGTDSQMLRCYWYVVDGVAPNPRLPQRNCNEDEILQWKEKQKKRLNEFWRDEETSHFSEKIDATLQELKWRKSIIERRFRGFRDLQNNISRKNHCLEFRRSGFVSYNLFNKKIRGEKTVDVNMAVDMVRLAPIYDTAVIISGDQDFVPAVQAVKNLGKHVINVAFLDNEGGLIPNGARHLNETTDGNYSLPSEEVKKYLITAE